VSNRVVRSALIQAHGTGAKEEIVERQVALLLQAADQDARIVCLQELSNSPYFGQEQNPRWFEWAEEIPAGSTTQRIQKIARETGMAVVLPLFERDGHTYYNSAAVIDADGTFLGKYRKLHIPQTEKFWEKFYFRPGNLGLPVFESKHAKIGVYICYDRHFPEGARMLGLQGADIVFIPTATAGRTKPLWMVESRAHAIANGYFVGSVNRIGVELDAEIDFYGSSYFCDPWGNVLAQGGDSEDEVVVGDLDLATVRPQFYYYRDRRPDVYEPLVES